MRHTRFCLLAALSLFAAFSLGAAEEKAASAPVGPPQPSVLTPMKSAPLPPRGTDPSWLLYQEGIRLFGEKRLGESLDSFRKAIAARTALSERATSDIVAAAAAKEAVKAKDSLSKLIALLAARELISKDYEALHAKAGGSIVAELGLLRERAPSSPLRGLIDAALLVVEERGLSRVGDSLSALAKSAAGLGKYPEAEYWIGKIYLAEGEARLAELQMLKACEMRDSLEVADDIVEMLESLAAIYRSQGNLKDCELKLREIADASELFSKRDAYYRNSMERTLAAQGFDRFQAVFRVPETLARSAYSELGSLYLDAGRPLAVIYLAAAVNADLTREIEAIKADSPNFAYKDLVDLSARILAERDLSLFASESGLWRDLVRLGQALSASGYRDSAREIWSAVSTILGPGDTWGRQAAVLAGTR
jgi:hypothetical protein